MNERDIVLDEKTKGMVTNYLKQIQSLQQYIDSLLQVVVNTKYPDSDDTYELSSDGGTLFVTGKISDKESKKSLEDS